MENPCKTCFYSPSCGIVNNSVPGRDEIIRLKSDRCEKLDEYREFLRRGQYLREGEM